MCSCSYCTECSTRVFHYCYCHVKFTLVVMYAVVARHAFVKLYLCQCLYRLSICLLFQHDLRHQKITQSTITCQPRASTVDWRIRVWRTHLTSNRCSSPADRLTLVTATMPPSTKQTPTEWARVTYACDLVEVSRQRASSGWVGDVTGAATPTSFFLESSWPNKFHAT